MCKIQRGVNELEGYKKNSGDKSVVLTRKYMHNTFLFFPKPYLLLPPFSKPQTSSKRYNPGNQH